MTAGNVSQPTGRILVVDDALENLNLLRSILNMRGHTVYPAENGLTALNIARSEPVDLVLLDIQMPDISGYQVAEQLKLDPATAAIPIIFISASNDIDGIIQAFDTGGVDYITKPFEYREVLARVASQLTLVDQRRQIEALREQDRQTYEALDRMKNEFISMATHDLRSPLNIIQGYIVLLEEVEVAERDRDLLNQSLRDMQISVVKMMQLVKDMLELIQLDSGGAITMQDTSLQRILNVAVSGHELLAAQQAITFEVDLPPQDITVRLDPERFARVIDNLVSNAIKYTPDGGTVRVAVDVGPDDFCVRVIDTGLGIPEEDLPHLFEAFFRVEAESHRGIPGTGLGLSIVRSIVEQHGGSLTVRSEYGRGSEFCVCIPR